MQAVLWQMVEFTLNCWIGPVNFFFEESTSNKSSDDEMAIINDKMICSEQETTL